MIKFKKNIINRKPRRILRRPKRHIITATILTPEEILKEKLKLLDINEKKKKKIIKEKKVSVT
ncbi:MAG: hypothetical protein HQ541_10100 [Mariniphaga sp.]|nr:hypothetical protein [Mariniphaga sp.]